MFKRVLSRKKKETSNAKKVGAEPPTCAEDNTEHDFFDGSPPAGEPPGFKRNGSPDLLIAKNLSPEILKHAVSQEVLKRSLSAKSQARLDMARWRSNGSCVFQESELVIDPLSISKSRLTVRRQSIGGDDITIGSSVGDVLNHDQEEEEEEEIPSRISLGRNTPVYMGQTPVSILRRPRESNDSQGGLRGPRMAQPLLDRESSEIVPFDESGYTEFFRHQQSARPCRAPPPRPIRKTATNWKKKPSLAARSAHITSFESILDGPLPQEEEEELSRKVLAPTHRILPERRRSKSVSPARQRRSESPKPVPNRRSVSFVDMEPEKKQRRFSFGFRKEQPACQVIVDDPLDQTTFCGLCFDSSCVWLFGEPTGALDCGCNNPEVCACGESYFGGTTKTKMKSGYDSFVETCSSSEDSIDKKKSDAPGQNNKKVGWWRRRRSSRPTEIQVERK